MFRKFLSFLSLFVLTVDGQELSKKFLPLSDVEGGSISIVGGCVNVVTGDYMESSTDLVVLGPEPLVFERFYSSSDYDTSVFFDGWRHSFDSSVEFANPNSVTPFFTEASGSTTRFKLQDAQKLKGTFIPAPNYKGYTNIGAGVVSGRLNIKNTKLEGDFKKNIITAICGNGDRKTYASNENTYFPLVKEEKASKNWLKYTYEASILKRVTALNKQQSTVFGWIDLKDPPNMKKKGGIFEVVASDGRKVFYEIKKFDKKVSQQTNYTYRIVKVSSEELPTVAYEYSKKDSIYDFQISRKTLPNNRFLEINYHKHTKNLADDFKIDRVSELKGPAGVNAEPVILYSFAYAHENDCAGMTTVKDALGSITKYHHDKNQRVDKIEKFCNSNNTLYSKVKFFWNDEGELLGKQLKDGQGNILVARVYEYDKRGNLIKDVIHGNIRGNSPSLSYAKSKDHVPDLNGANYWRVLYKYSDDGLNLLLEEKEQNGKKTCYGYVPGTDLLAWKFIYENEVLRIRQFYKYDDNAVLTCEITDDGRSKDENDFKDVTQRTIRRITLQKTQPIGLPKEVEEFYLDLSTGKECLLSKCVNEFSQTGRLLSQKHFDSSGIHKYTLNWTYDAHGNIIKQNSPLGDIIEREFNENNDLVFESSFRKDSSKKLTYDFMGRLIKVEEEHSDKTVYVTSNKYDVKGQLIAFIDHFGLTTQHEYDALGRLILTKHPEYANHVGKQIATTKYAYDVFDNIIEHTDPNGSVTKKTYNIYKQPLQIIYPDGTTEKFSYNEDGSLENFTARNGLVAKHKHDCFGRLLSKELYAADGIFISRTSATYNSFQKTSETDSEGRITYYKYDFAGRLIAVEKANTLILHTYDSWGRIAVTQEGITSDSYLLKRFTYDKNNRIVEEKEEDQKGVQLCYIQYAYDAAGNRTQVINSNGVSQTEYNSMQLPTLLIDALGRVTRYHYNFYAKNAQGQQVLEQIEIDSLGCQTIAQMNALKKPVLVLKKDSLGQILAKKELFYDKVGNLIRTGEDVIFQGESLHQVITDYKYNKVNQLISLTEAVDTPNQKCTEHQYNSYGQKAIIIKPDGTKIKHTYDDKGRLKHFESDDNRIAYTYRYNANDEIIAVEDSLHNQITTRAYDLNGYMIQEKLGHGYTINYTYDALGRPLKASLPDQSAISYEYTEGYLKKVERLTSENKVKYSHEYTSYDLSKNLLESKTADANTVHYTYNACGQLTQIASREFNETICYNDKGSISATDSTFTAQNYAYDSLMQLKSEKGTFNHTYEHDSLYNCRSKDGFEQKISVLNQILETSTNKYTYDRNGNRLTQNGVKFVYDALDRLVEVYQQDKKITYTYDAFNRRLSKIGDGQNLYYIYFGQNEVGSFDKTGLREFRVLGVGKGAEIGATIAIELKDQFYVPVSDHNGNIVALLSPSGTLEESYRYTAYGEEEKSSALGNPWRFSSKRVDEETGLVNYGRRYYDPKSLTWLTPDPLGFEAGPNLYAFLLNSPIDHIDLYGLEGISGGRGYCVSSAPASGRVYQSPYAGNDQFKRNSPIHRAIRMIASIPGRIMQTIGDHLIPIPVVREVISYAGYVCQGRSREWQPSWIRSRSQVLEPAGNYQGSKLEVEAVNGMMTSLEDVILRTEQMTKACESENIHSIYSASKGFLGDILESASLILGLANETVNLATQELRGSSLRVGPDGEIILCLYSKGGLEGWRALNNLTNEQRAQINVLTFGSAKIIPPEGFKSCTNYIRYGDLIPVAGDPLGISKAFLFPSNNVVFLPSNGLENHSWDKNYSVVFRNAVSKFKAPGSIK